MTITWRQRAKTHPRAVDVALVVLLILAASGPAVLNSMLSFTDNLSWRSAVPLAAIGSVALLWRRSRQLAVVAVTTVCAAAAGVLGYLITPVLLAPVMIALYELAVRVPGMWWHWGVVTAVIMLAGLVGAADGYPWPLQLVSSALFLLLPVALAEATRLRRDHLAAVEARAEYAERNREEEARHRVAEERVRMARELHDVVAHHLALANAQAGTAAYLADSRPDQVKRILTELTGTTSAALRELKATVGLLRQPEDTASPLEPVPGLGRLPELTAAFAAAGLAVEVTVDGAERALSPGVDLTAFRIVQEALTNVAKHGTADTASVHLAYGADRLTVTITNDAEPAVVRPGFGLVGMRERATSAGGRLVAGPGPGDSFTVTTELPILGTP